MNSSNIQRFRLAEDAFFKAYNLDKKEHYIKILEYDINVRVQEVGSGSPLIFIHGGPNAGTTWVQFASLLTGYKCLLIDRPGCGLSDAIDYWNFTGSDLTDLIKNVIDGVLYHFQILKAPFFGSSFGGYWILKYSLCRPERVTKLIVEGCPALVEGMAIPQFMKVMTKPVMRWLIPKLPTTKTYSKKIMKDIGHMYSIDHNLIPEIFSDWYVSLCNNTDTMKNDIAVINKTFAGGEMNPQYILYDRDIATIYQPTLWLWGKDDPFGGIDLGNRLNSIMKNSSIIGFDNSGHLPWIDNPELHANKVREFLRT